MHYSIDIEHAALIFAYSGIILTSQRDVRSNKPIDDCGVLYGSVLGLHMVAINVNDISQVVNGKCFLHADFASILVSEETDNQNSVVLSKI